MLGVIRDNCGSLHTAYSVFFSHGSNNFVEMTSLLEGVQKCYQFGFRKVEIETNSQLPINWITKGDCNIWYLENFLEELQRLLGSMEYRLTYIFH